MNRVEEIVEDDMEVEYCDWDQKELNDVLSHGLAYTVRSSKYPR